MPDQSRDQLAEILHKQGAYCGTCDFETPCKGCDKVLASYADAILAAGFQPPPRVITEPADLDRMPLGSVVLAYGVAHQACPDEYGVDPVWLKPTGRAAQTGLELLMDTRGEGVTVLYEPTEVPDHG
ncbi:hypothetical protein [Nocardia wallacei]|uniref:hypothetical protein n=1 Tax=Nocardia wallacei TaxID=480035 RepID=UPI002456BEFC|nr:hypothetical protein [Nocardia wallacei]